MLDKNYVKPIPKSILAKIKREDRTRYKSPSGQNRFYSYLAVWKKELVKITVAVIAKNPSDLDAEGKALHHCVGKGVYDKKMSKGETLIFFIRRINEMETPFVTFEYSPSSKKILQCYAHNNTKPEDNVMQFVENKWLPNANKKVQKIAA